MSAERSIDGVGTAGVGTAGVDDDVVFRQVGEEVIYEGFVISVVVGEFEGPDGERFRRDIVRHPGAVSAVPLDGDHIYLVRQFRSSIGRNLWEIPAGRRDVDGEEPVVTAARELEEEIGKRPGRLELLLTLYHSPGFCDEYGYVFLATDLVDVPKRLDGPEEEHMVVARVGVDEAVAMVFDGRITDAKSIAGILAVARRLGR